MDTMRDPLGGLHTRLVELLDLCSDFENLFDTSRFPDKNPIWWRMLNNQLGKMRAWHGEDVPRASLVFTDEMAERVLLAFYGACNLEVSDYSFVKANLGAMRQALETLNEPPPHDHEWVLAGPVDYRCTVSGCPAVGRIQEVTGNG